MPSTLIAPAVEFAEVPRKKWTRDEWDLVRGMLDLFMYELIDGDLIENAVKSHVGMVGMMNVVEWLRMLFSTEMVGFGNTVGVGPEDNDSNEPQPDAALLTRQFDGFPRPSAAEVLLVVEVSDTTLAFDLNQKAILYARAVIPEYWVLDVVGRRIIVHRRPLDGRYCDVMAYDETESVASLAAPDSSVVVSALLYGEGFATAEQDGPGGPSN